MTDIDKPWRYVVPMRHPQSGEERTVIIELSISEMCQASPMLHTGGPDGPIAKSLACHRAERENPGFWSRDPIAPSSVH